MLGVSGWTEAVVPRALIPPPEQVMATLRSIYRPPSVDKDEIR